MGTPKETEVPKVKDVEVPKLKNEVEKTEREKADEAFRKLPPEEKAKYIDDTYDIVEGAPRQPRVHKPVSTNVESAQLKLGTKEEIGEQADKELKEAKTDEDILAGAALKSLANADNKDLKLEYGKSAEKVSSEKEEKILDSAKKVLPESQVDDFKAYLKEQGKNPDSIDKETLVDSYASYVATQNKQLSNVVSSNGVKDAEVVRKSDEVSAKEVVDTVDERVKNGELKDTTYAKNSAATNKQTKATNESTPSQSGVVSSKNVAKASDEPVTGTKQGKLSDTGLGDTSTAPFAMVSLALALMLAKRKMDLKKESK